MKSYDLLDNRYRFDSQVDIIIPYHGKYTLVSNLIESIFKFTKSNYYNLFIVDDCSVNEEFLLSMKKAWLKRNEKRNYGVGIQFIRNEEQLGFGGACKTGYDLGNSPYVCILQSDCMIKDVNWLRRLGNTLWNMKKHNVRMVSPKLTNIAGGSRLQQAQFDEVGTFVKEDDVVLKDEFISLSCFMAHRELFKKIGGFIKPYPLGGYEDEELYLRMQHYGFKQGICGSTYVEHLGHETFREVMRENANEFRNIYDQNYERCLQDIQRLKNIDKK